jgi:hypothetical protein
MSRIESISNHEHHHKGPLVGASQDRKIRHYGGIYPLTVIDIPGKRDNSLDHLSLNSFSNFEFSKAGDPDTIKLVRGHHSEVLFSFIGLSPADGKYRYQLISPDGIIGNLETDENETIAPFFASLFNSNQEHLDFSEGVEVDFSVLEYISTRTGLVIERPIVDESAVVA